MLAVARGVKLGPPTEAGAHVRFVFEWEGVHRTGDLSFKYVGRVGGGGGGRRGPREGRFHF